MATEGALDEQAYGDQQAAAYEFDPEHQLFDGESAVWLEEINKLGLNADSRILDFGAGTGSLLASLNARGLNAVGLEPSAQMIQQGLRQYPGLNPAHFVLGSADDEQVFQDASFDVITSRQVLCHLREPARVFKRLRTWLKPGGALMLVDGYWSAQSWRPNDLSSLPFAAMASTDPVTSLLRDLGFEIAHAGPFDALNAARKAIYEQTIPRYLILAKRYACR